MVFFCTKNIAVSERWESILGDKKGVPVYDFEEIGKSDGKKTVVFLDLDTCSGELAKISSDPDFEINSLKIMAFEKVPDPQSGKRLLSLGVKAYANTWIMPLHLLSALDTVENGGIWLYPEFVHSLVNELKPQTAAYEESPVFKKFTPREKELAALILSGLNNSQISGRLGISERTVKAHITNILKKAHVSDRLSFVLLMKE